MMEYEKISSLLYNVFQDALVIAASAECQTLLAHLANT